MQGVKKSAAPLRCGVTCKVASDPNPDRTRITRPPESLSLPAAPPPAPREGFSPSRNAPINTCGYAAVSIRKQSKSTVGRSAAIIRPQRSFS